MTIYEKLSDMIEQTRFAEDGAQSLRCKQIWQQTHDKLVARRNGLTIHGANMSYEKLSTISRTLQVSPWAILEAFGEVNN